MPDREKVIKGLECCYCNFPKQMDCKNCPYDKICYHDKACSLMLRDALALLKEQESANLYKCPNCGTWVSAGNVVRCKDCKYYDIFSQECRNGIDGIMTPNFYCGNAERKEGR